MPNSFWLIVAGLVAGIIMIPALPYVLMGIGLYAIVRKLVRIFSPSSSEDSGRAGPTRSSGN